MLAIYHVHFEIWELENHVVYPIAKVMRKQYQRYPLFSICFEGMQLDEKPLSGLIIGHFVVIWCI